MLGDSRDIRGRLRAVLPLRWFADQSPNLDALLDCIATPWAWLYSLISYVICQTRLESASDQWLDIISHDFLGNTLLRRSGEADLSYRARIQWAFVEEAATRAAISSSIFRLTGTLPEIFEPANSRDTGSYGAEAPGSTASFAGLSYGVVGGWGSLQLPFQFFISVRLPVLLGLSSVAGYGTGFGGYGVGPIIYVDVALLNGSVSIRDIQQSLAVVLPVTTSAWLRIS